MTQQTLFSNEEYMRISWFSNALKVLGIEEVPGWPDHFGDSLIQWNSRNTYSTFKVLSLFSGAGGLDIGFHDAGFQIVECNEIEKSFSATLLENSKPGKRLHGSKVVCMDINDYVPSIDGIDFIIGGPPCQTFSAAGARAAGVNGTDDPRGNLFKQYVRILEKLRPRGFLFENVYRIVGAQGGKPWKQIQEAFSAAGYKLFWRILDAADFGVPQFRERLIIVGLRKGKFQFPSPTHGPDSVDNRPYYTASCAIADVKSEVTGITIGGRHGHLLNDIPPGLNYSFYTDRMGHPTPLFGWRSKFSDYLYKADPDTPVRTIKAQGGQYTGPFHWDNRTFTIKELMRLQTFPDSYIINGNRQKAIQQLGNSVPPQLARILSLSILQQVFGVQLPVNIELLPDSFKLGFRARKSKLTKIYAKKAADAISKYSNNSAVNCTIEKFGKSYCILSEDLRLKQCEHSEEWDYFLEHSIQAGSIRIMLWDKLKHGISEYKYTVQTKQIHKFNIGISSITMQSFSKEPRSITALWKYAEQLVKEYFFKDDLIQLFGYYQYKQNYTIKIQFDKHMIADDVFWQVFSNISHGHNVRKLVSLSELSYEYDIGIKLLITQLRKLKSLGFEIRNHNTNSQIPEDYVLIPYSFPSLNERSLQRQTEL